MDENSDEYEEHIRFCESNMVPFVCVFESNLQYSTLQIKIFRKKSEHGIKFDQHIIPIYNVYSKLSGLTEDYTSISSVKNMFTLTIFKKDSILIAGLIYDIALELIQEDIKLIENADKINKSFNPKAQKQEFEVLKEFLLYLILIIAFIIYYISTYY